jgi:hypothetical protein
MLLDRHRHADSGRDAGREHPFDVAVLVEALAVHDARDAA